MLPGSRLFGNPPSENSTGAVAYSEYDQNVAEQSTVADGEFLSVATYFAGSGVAVSKSTAGAAAAARSPGDSIAA